MPSNLPNRIGGIPFLYKADILTSGRIFWVDSNTGSDSAANAGRDPRLPYATIDYAIGQCTANKGDVIYVMPGHAETISAAADIDADIAGITIQGLGNGTNRPLITLDTAAAADFDINAANVTVRGLQFTSEINDLANFITIGANNATIEDCYFYTANTYEALCFINLETTYDWLTVNRCQFKQPTDPEGTDGNAGTGCFYFVDSENIFVNDCYFDGYFETAIFHNKTTAAKNVWISNSYGIQMLSGAEWSTQETNMSGGCRGSLFIVRGSADVAEANLTGTISANFFMNLDTGFGNDGGGGQNAVQGGAAAAS